MSGDIKKYIYIIGTICVVFVAGAVILKLLPWILLAGAVVYTITKVVGYFKRKNREIDKDNYKKNNNEYIYKEPESDYTNGEIIDVEYEDVDK